MKFILRCVIVFGFIIILGSAGNADVSNTSTVANTLNALLGTVIMFSGISANLHYSRYLEKRAKKALAEKKKRAAKRAAAFAD